MKLILREYLRGLRERDELDVLLPNLLSESGMTVISRPSVGVRQYGVDVAAVGLDTDGIKKIFLISIKAGNLDRASWDIGEQALRPSLNEIIDSYISSRIKPDHAGLPIVIAICFGGDMDQGVEHEVIGYIKKNSRLGLEYQIWNGDEIVDRFLTKVIGEQLLNEEERSLFRKSIAMLDEPEASYSYFSKFIHLVFGREFKTHKDRLRAIYQVNICLWILFVWARELDNLESSYKCSEIALLYTWGLSSAHLGKNKITAKKYADVIDSILKLHLQIILLFCDRKIIPGTSIQHGLSEAVQSRESVDINLKLFDTLGRLALSGIWLRFLHNNSNIDDQKIESAHFEAILKFIKSLADLINNNPILKSPLKDDQVIDIQIACIFLAQERQWSFIRDWISEIVGLSIFALRSNEHYPCTLRDYRDLLDHPKNEEEGYLERVTDGSVLYPTLAIWAYMLGENDLLRHLSKFIEEKIPHCTLQLWFIGEDSEEHLFLNDALHGMTLTDLKIEETGKAMISAVNEELKNDIPFNELSIIRFSQWPILLTACRHHRLPVPPNFWKLSEAEIEKIDWNSEPDSRK